MESLFSGRDKKFTPRSWVVVTSIALAFLCWGIFIFLAVGDKGQPSWDFNIVEDIPSQSVYSTHRAKQIFGEQAPLVPQHVPGVTPHPNQPAAGAK